MSELDDLLGEHADILKQTINMAAGQFMAMAENVELSKAMAKMCKNNYEAFKEAGFDDDRAFQLTMATMKNAAK